ncbi:hypothetical protein BDM02DRAFT_3116022 [Thelephora ganbajun]|uniref:Uncharacterized protein n=1 Tax=Thelephora ganbajun TaxID=370292 RepID=A0ACB6ZFG4_THEGA|nr:hypothetical protein BDM02DRAFT_3116022 [Thelephora ganbajun]
MKPLISMNVSLLPESQASQIVREALRGGVDTPKQITQEEPQVYVEDNLTSSDIKSSPHYHYHGLAVTQSQDGHGGEDSQGSQETSHSSVTGLGQNVVSLDHLAPPLSPKSPSDANEPPGTPSPSKAGKTVSFVSPQRPPVTPLRKSRSLHTPARRSPSPQSQDSFAGSIPISPQAAFLAKSKRFGLPLSQLENSLEDSMFSPVASKPNAGPSLIVGMSQSSSDESNSQNTQPMAPAQEESQPQTTEYTQDTNYMEYLTCINNNRNPYIDRSGANFPQSPDSSSSSSGNFPENEPHSYEEPTQVAESTQPVPEEVPTQPSTQVVNETAKTQTAAPSESVPSENVPSEDVPSENVPSENVPPSANSYQTPAASAATPSTNNRSLYNQLKRWRMRPGIPHHQQPTASRGQSTPIVPETQPFEIESSENRSTGEGGIGTNLSTLQQPPSRPLPPDYPLQSPKFMPPPKPPRVDEDETMDVVPDSEPSRVADGPMSSLHLPRAASRVLILAEDDNETVPESSGETDNEISVQRNLDLIAQGERMQETEPETEQGDDPMDSDQPLIKQRARRPPKPALEEEEEEEQVEQEVDDDATVPETEDEVPLVVLVKSKKVTPKPLPPRSRSTRNKRPIIYTESPDTSENEEEEKPEETPTERPAKKRKVEKVEKPETDVTPATTRGRGRKAKQPSSTKAVKSTAKGSATKAKPQKARGRGKKASAEASNVSSSGRNTPPAQDDGAKTEPAEDDEEADFEASDDIQLAKKRKRPGVDQKLHRTASGNSTLQGVTPQRGGSKRIRSLPGSLRDIAQNDCTRVFARWPLCKHFYTGFVHSRSPVQSDLYVVRFDDGTECPVHISDLRQCELEKGDEVFVIGYKQSGRVTAIDRWDTEGYVRVQVDTGGELDVKASSIKIHESVIDEDWGERLVHENSICTLLQAQGLNTSASKSTAVNGTSTSKFLKRIGFVVTMKSANDKNRTRIFDLIKNNGGKVIEDWTNLFPFSPAQTDRSWVVRQADVKHKDLGVQTVFLLADESNQKPKYLVALALGIPCVSTQWLLDCREQHALINWTSYLLPAGEYTHGLMSQRVNLRWGDKSQQLRETYRDTYGSNSTLHGKSVLCIGPELFPPGKSRGLKRFNSEDDRQNESTRKLPSIVLAMGADHVEAVCDVKYALYKTFEYDFVLVKDVEEVKKFNATRKGDRPPCVHIPWIKECLIAGKLLDIPDV